MSQFSWSWLIIRQAHEFGLAPALWALVRVWGHSAGLTTIQHMLEGQLWNPLFSKCVPALVLALAFLPPAGFKSMPLSPSGTIHISFLNYLAWRWGLFPFNLRVILAFSFTVVFLICYRDPIETGFWPEERKSRESIKWNFLCYPLILLLHLNYHANSQQSLSLVFLF